MLKLTNLSKVLYPECGFTKGQVIDYYQLIAPTLLPHIAWRPLTFKRYPNGVAGKFFYQKNAPQARPDWVPTATIATPGSRRGRDTVQAVVAGDRPTLIWAANMADLKIHTPMCRIAENRTCWCSTWTPARRPPSCNAAGWPCCCTHCWPSSDFNRWPRPRAARGCSCSPR